MCSYEPRAGLFTRERAGLFVLFIRSPVGHPGGPGHPMPARIVSSVHLIRPTRVNPPDPGSNPGQPGSGQKPGRHIFFRRGVGLALPIIANLQNLEHLELMLSNSSLVQLFNVKHQ